MIDIRVEEVGVVVVGTEQHGMMITNRTIPKRRGHLLPTMMTGH
jgi:hypothetical protein